MKYFILFILLCLGNNYLSAQVIDTLNIGSSKFISMEVVIEKTYLVKIQLFQNNDTLRFFVPDNSEDMLYYKDLNMCDIISNKIILQSISNHELCAMFGFRGSDYTIIDESFNVIIDSRLKYYKQINAKIIAKQDSIPINSKKPK
jgi:hypothetical protein